MEYLISAVIGYLFGSFPTAYLLIKRIKGIDITKNGSGNVGAYNSFRVTKSKYLGFVVLLIDSSKGALPALILIFLFPNIFIYPAIAVLFAVFSHCFNPWLKFKGGRGLATAAGGAAMIFPFLLIVWAILWVIFYLMRKNILFSNIAATILSLLLLYNIIDVAIKYTHPKTDDISSLIFVSTSVLIIIFIKHIDPFKEYLNKHKSKRIIKND
jgi:glycerol-3-phosphate acyltransferase PlsY